MRHLIALGLGRYIARLPDLSGRDVESVARRVGPVLDGYLANGGATSEAHAEPQADPE